MNLKSTQRNSKSNFSSSIRRSCLFFKRENKQRRLVNRRFHKDGTPEAVLQRTFFLKEPQVNPNLKLASLANPNSHQEPTANPYLTPAPSVNLNSHQEPPANPSLTPAPSVNPNPHREPQAKPNLEPFIDRVKNYKTAFDFYQKNKYLRGPKKNLDFFFLENY